MNNINYKVLPKIIEKTDESTGMMIHKIYKDTLRYLINTFSNVYYIDKNNNSVKVKCFHANQERAVAKSFVGDNITLPVISISETTSNADAKRRRYNPILVNDSHWDPRKNRAIRVLSLVPRPVDIDYSINIWAKYKEDLDQIRETIYYKFNPDLEINTKYLTKTKAFITNESPANTMEADDTEDRVLRSSLSIKVETYIPSPKFLYTSTGKIEQLNFDFEFNDFEDAKKPRKVTVSKIDGILTLLTIDGQEVNLPIISSSSDETGCQLVVVGIDGLEYNIPVNCDVISSIGTL